MHKLRGKKKLMIEALQKQLGVVSAAVDDVGIARRTHYNWLESDPNYKKAVDEIPDLVIDFAENALFKLIQENNAPATMFFLKTKGKNRGYQENKQIDANITGPAIEQINLFREAFKDYLDEPDTTEGDKE